MPRLPQIPATVAEVLDPAREFEPAVIEALKKFRAAKPWRGSDDERLAKFRAVLADLALAYEMENAPKLERLDVGGGHGGGYHAPSNTIVIANFSVVTFLHCFCRARGQRPYECFGWSLNLFARTFPGSFARAQQRGPFLVTE